MAARVAYPIETREKALELLRQGVRVRDVAKQTNTTPAAVSYWKAHKLSAEERQSLSKGNGADDGVKELVQKHRKAKEGGARLTAVRKAMTKAVDSMHAVKDDRVHMAITNLREARKLIQQRGGKQSRAELYALLALDWLEGG